MKIDNPCSWFIDGSEEESFTYENTIKDIPYFVSFRTERYVPIGLLVFASGLDDARKKMKQMIEKRLEVFEKYKKNDGECLYIEEGKVELAKKFLAALKGEIVYDGDNKFTLTIQKAPTNQCYDIHSSYSIL